MSWDQNDGVGKGGWRVQETGHTRLSERRKPVPGGVVSKIQRGGEGRPAGRGECFPRVMSSAWRLEMGCGGWGEAG